MAKTLYLHVGTHKTATTALQDFCARNADRLRESVLYPATGRARMGAHHLFFSSIRIPQHPGFPPRRTFEEYVRDLHEETRSAERILMSSEILSEKIDTDALQKLQEIAGRVVIILYLRPQHEYAVSLYNELVKNTPWVRPLSEMAAKVQGDYHRLCQRWAESFGKENLIVRPFQRSQFVGGSVFSDLLSIFGLALTDGFALPDGRTNPSLSRDEVEFKRAVNGLPLDSSRLRDVRDRLMEYSRTRRKDPPAPGGWLGAAERAKIMRRFEPSNARVAMEFLGREDGRLFRDDDAGAEGDGEAYAGLSARGVREMAAYLREEDPELFREIAGMLAEGEAADPARDEAVRTLLPGFAGDGADR